VRLLAPAAVLRLPAMNSVSGAIGASVCCASIVQ
jgi:hypothetical protein